MLALRKHFTRCAIAGVVALMPLAGTIATIVYLESQIASSWLRDQGFYFFGCGLLLAVAVIYLIGLTISSFLGRWLWSIVDRVLEQLPLLGSLYQTLKQIVGYGEGPDAVFREAVLIPSRDLDGDEIGLVTYKTQVANRQQLTVFVPAAPTLTTGRLVVIDADKVKPAGMSVNEALKSLVSLGTLVEDA